MTLSTGDNVVYTAPAGKRALVTGIGVYNSNASSRNFYPTLVVSGTHYRIAATLACNASSANQVATAINIILEPGESYGINVTGSDVNGFLRVVEFDDTCPIYTAKKLGSWSAGNNTLYTVPSGKSAILIDGTAGVNQNATAFFYYNSSGGSRALSLHSVESGGTPTSGNKVWSAAAISNDTRVSVMQSHTMAAGDSIVINTDSNANTQVAWVMVAEL